MGKVYAVCMNKGGVGKTSMVTNLAATLAKKHKKKVLIIDTDAQGNTSIAFGKNPSNYLNTIYDVLVDDLHPEIAIDNVKKNIDLLPANDNMDFLEFDVLPHLDKYTRPYYLLKDGMKNLKEQYDYIFIDTPPSLGFVVGNVLTYADHVLIPFVPEAFDVKGLVRVMKTINGFKKNYNPDLSVAGVIGMKVEGGTTLHTQMLEEARRYCARSDIYMYKAIIPKTIAFAKAVAYDKMPATLLPSEAKNELVQAYSAIADEFIKHESPAVKG